MERIEVGDLAVYVAGPGCIEANLGVFFDVIEHIGGDFYVVVPKRSVVDHMGFPRRGQCICGWQVLQPIRPRKPDHTVTRDKEIEHA